MPRFFVSADQVADGRGVITGADAAHLTRALRVRSGELVVVVDDAGREHGLRVDAAGTERVEGAVQWSRAATGEPRRRVHVVQAVPQTGMDSAVEVMTEVGVASIRPFLAERGVIRLDARRSADRQARWQAVAREAAGLALRGAIPRVHPPLSLDAALATLPPGCPVLTAVVGDGTPLAGAVAADTVDVAVVVGPEGGLSSVELDLLAAHGARPVHLGPRVLRSRLAGTVAVALLLMSSGDLAHPASFAAPL